MRTSPLRILAVIVLYRSTPDQSVAFTTLQHSITAARNETLECGVFLHDNSPSTPIPVAPPVIYEAAEGNRGLASAYNRALSIAVRDGYDWLLTLDQDTPLPTSFLSGMGKHLQMLANDVGVGAVVPQLLGNQKRISPNRFVAGVWPQYYPLGYIGLTEPSTFAFNSGSILRVSALEEVGGYDLRFWLDYCDASMFCRLHRAGKRIFLAGDVVIDHEFSMQDFKNRVSLARYANIVSAGSAFWDLEMNTLAGLDHTARLAFRVIKHLYRRDGAAYLKVTLRQLRQRLLWSKRKRLEEWTRISHGNPALHIRDIE